MVRGRIGTVGMTTTGRQSNHGHCASFCVISAREREIDQIERALGCGAHTTRANISFNSRPPSSPSLPSLSFLFSFFAIIDVFLHLQFTSSASPFSSPSPVSFFFSIFYHSALHCSSDCCSHRPIVPLLLCSDISPSSCQPSSPLRPPRVKFQHPQTHSIPHRLPATLFRPSHLPRDHLLQPLFAKQTFRDPAQIPSTSSLLPQKIHHSRFISSKLQTRRYIYNPPVPPLPSFTGSANPSSMSLRAVSHVRIA